jgi:hypothetical protein
LLMSLLLVSKIYWQLPLDKQNKIFIIDLIFKIF